MKFVNCFTVFCLCLLMGACNIEKDEPYVYKKEDILVGIGPYEQELEAWNSQNMLDYRLSLLLEYGGSQQEKAIVTVKNGIAESSTPPAWLLSGEKSTVPEFFSFITEMVQALADRESRETGPLVFKVEYDEEYHYPSIIFASWNLYLDGMYGFRWEISLTPLGDNNK